MTSAGLEARDIFAPGRFLSLRDIAEMLKAEIHVLMKALDVVDGLNDTAESGNANYVFSKKQNRDWFEKNLSDVKDQADALGLRLSSHKAEYMRILVSQHQDEQPALAIALLMQNNLPELRDRICQELELVRLYCVKPDKITYCDGFERRLDLAQVLVDKFPDAIEDVSEALTALGFSRNTASVFHLMRALEYIVRVLGEKLGVSIIDTHDKVLEWGKILANINAAVTTMPKGEQKDKWSAACSLLWHVKQAWRNSTMHPKQTYSDNEASAVFEASKAFIIFLGELV